MPLSFFSRPFRPRSGTGLAPWAALDLEAVRIGEAIEHVDQHGNLDGFPGAQSEKLALTMTAGRQGLVTWNLNRERYELTSLGRQRLEAQRLVAVSARQPPVSPAPGKPEWSRRNAATAIAGGRLNPAVVVAGLAGAALGATLIAALPGGPFRNPEEPTSARQQQASSGPTRPAEAPTTAAENSRGTAANKSATSEAQPDPVPVPDEPRPLPRRAEEPAALPDPTAPKEPSRTAAEPESLPKPRPAGSADQALVERGENTGLAAAEASQPAAPSGHVAGESARDAAAEGLKKPPHAGPAARRQETAQDGDFAGSGYAERERPRPPELFNWMFR